jgi:hypothetical protein
MQENLNAFDNSLPQAPLTCETPAISLSGLADLIIALEDELAQCPSPAALMANSLREMILEAIDDEC